MFGHHSTTHNPMVKWNILWIPLNVLCSKQRRRDNNKRDTIYISPFIPNNTKCYSEKWNVSRRSTHWMKTPDYTGCFMPTKTQRKARCIPKQNKTIHSQCTTVCEKLQAWTTKLDSRYQTLEKKKKKKDCLSMTFKMINNSGYGTESNNYPDKLRTTRLTTCQPFHSIY